MTETSSYAATPAEQIARAEKRIEAALEMVREMREALARQNAADPTNWAIAGDSTRLAGALEIAAGMEV